MNAQVMDRNVPDARQISERVAAAWFSLPPSIPRVVNSPVSYCDFGIAGISPVSPNTKSPVSQFRSIGPNIIFLTNESSGRSTDRN